MATTHSSSLLIKRNTLASTFAPRDRIELTNDLIPPLDMLVVFIAAFLSTVMHAASSLLAGNFLTSATSGASSLSWTTSLGLIAFDFGAYHSIVPRSGSIVVLAIVLAPVMLYDPAFAIDISRDQAANAMRRYAARLLAFATVTLLIGSATGLLNDLAASWLTMWAGGVVFGTAFIRRRVVQKVKSLAQCGDLIESVAIIGVGARATQLHKDLLANPPRNINVIGLFDDVDKGVASTASDTAHSVTSLIRLAKAGQVDWVLIAATQIEPHLQELINDLQQSSARVALCMNSQAWPPNPVQSMNLCATDYIGTGMPVVLLADRPIKRWNVFIKRAEDVVLGSLLLVLLSPILAAVALAIRLDSPGPILFKQRRHAFNNSEFDIYKFRTMKWRAASDSTLQQTERNDPRVTRIGRWLRELSLDELPQLLNVIRGEMSLVGPRPHAVNMQTESRFGWEITDRYAHRHRVKPGMTGWSQVNGARGATVTVAQLQRRVDLDLFYIDHWSLLFDLKILLMTVRVVVSRTNAY